MPSLKLPPIRQESACTQAQCHLEKRNRGRAPFPSSRRKNWAKCNAALLRHWSWVRVPPDPSAVPSLYAPTRGKGQCPKNRRALSCLLMEAQMPKGTMPFAKTASGLPLSRAAKQVAAFLSFKRIEGYSAGAYASRASRLGCLIAWAQGAGVETLDADSLRSFFAYLRTAHEDKAAGPRFGDERSIGSRPLSTATIATYHANLKTFFAWLVEEGVLESSPMERVPKPIDRPDQIRPFTQEQVQAIRRAAHTARERAVFCLLLDTGMRVSELCGLHIADVDLSAGAAWIARGKGGKGRSVPFSGETRKAIYSYLKQRGGIDVLREEDPLLVAETGPTAGEALGTQGVHRMVQVWGQRAGLSGVRCSPHTFRHTFAVMFLRAGGNAFTLKAILGHETLSTTQKYVALAEADVARQHAQFSPVAALSRKGTR